MPILPNKNSFVFLPLPSLPYSSSFTHRRRHPYIDSGSNSTVPTTELDRHHQHRFPYVFTNKKPSPEAELEMDSAIVHDPPYNPFPTSTPISYPSSSPFPPTLHHSSPFSHHTFSFENRNSN